MTEAQWTEQECQKLADQILDLRVKVRVTAADASRMAAEMTRLASKLDDANATIEHLRRDLEKAKS